MAALGVPRQPAPPLQVPADTAGDGHTPKFNATDGRDHWGQCFSIALAGGGVRGGVVHGKSDGHAAFPVSGRVEPRDLLATMFHCLGHAAETQLYDTEGRPIPISRGRVIDEIL